jgi:hypothetical protein
MSRNIRLVVGVVLAVAFVAGYAFALSAFRATAQGGTSDYPLGHDAGPDYVSIDARLTSIDPGKGEAVIRLDFTPKGKFDSKGKLAQDLKITVNADTGAPERAFAKGKFMAATDVVLGLTGDQITGYPFDQQQASLALFMEIPGKNGAEDEPVPVDLTLTTAAHGFSITQSADPDNSDINPIIDLSVSRAGSTLFFAIFVMTAMWLLALAVLALAWRVVLAGLKPELPMMALLSALLFAFPAMRNAVPGAPPIGSLNDYLSFFWCEGLIAVSLISIVATWLVRVAHAPKGDVKA